MGGSQALTADQAHKTALAFDVIVGYPRTFAPYLADMQLTNPKLKFIAYMNGAYAQDTQGSAYPDALYARSATGSKVRSVAFGNYLMDITNPDWSVVVSRECGNGSSDAGWDGCYLDMLGPGTLTPGYVTAAPINPATGAEWTERAWMAATSALAAKVASDNPGRFMIANGLGTGRQYFDPAWGPTSKLMAGVQGGNAQGFIRGTSAPVNDFRKADVWKQDVEMLKAAGLAQRSVFAMTKIWGVPATQAQKDAVHRFALASFLLGTDGNQYFFWSDDGSQGAYPQRHRYERLNIGRPTGADSTTATGVVIRPFDGGMVAVNPGDLAVTVDLGTAMTSLDGLIARTVILLPHAGDVYKL